MPTYNKHMKQFNERCLTIKRMNTSHYMRYTTVLHGPPKITEAKTHLNTSSVKLPVTSRVNPPYLKCIYMVEKKAYSRGVIFSLTNNVSMVG